MSGVRRHLTTWSSGNPDTTRRPKSRRTRHGLNSYAGYDTAHTRAAVGQRGPRGWLRVSGRGRGVVPPWNSDQRHCRPARWPVVLCRVQSSHAAGSHGERHAGAAARGRAGHRNGATRRGEARRAIRRVHLYRAGRDPSRRALDGRRKRAACAHAVGRDCGPSARMALASVLGDEPVVHDIGANDFRDVRRDGERLVLIGHEDLGVPAVDACGSPAACEALTRDLLGAGAAELGASALEALRIEAGTPRFGIDMTEDTIPLEAGIEARAISMTKRVLCRPGGHHPYPPPGARPRGQTAGRVEHRGHERAGARFAAGGRRATGSAFSPVQPSRPRRGTRSPSVDVQRDVAGARHGGDGGGDDRARKRGGAAVRRPFRLGHAPV